ncbi:hypothetical protein B7494_g7748 [Chlorociboria aeruginascens]|nr:hypothetical protein B7494_g7748 [Chlorociboria aeruginascens]
MGTLSNPEFRSRKFRQGYKVWTDELWPHPYDTFPSTPTGRISCKIGEYNAAFRRICGMLFLYVKHLEDDIALAEAMGLDITILTAAGLEQELYGYQLAMGFQICSTSPSDAAPSYGLPTNEFLHSTPLIPSSAARFEK